jgi:hypothetical protein
MNAIWKNNQFNFLSTLVTPSGSRVQLDRPNLWPKLSFNLLQPLRQWLDNIEIQDRKTARFLSNAIPAQCPFERDIMLFGRKIAHIPPLCKLNPFYEQLVGLRFRALCFLVDRCGEEVHSY